MDSESSSSRHNKLESILQDQSLEPHNIPLKELTEITNDFSDERLLGQGGFGMVYKGVRRNEDMIAVKKLMWTTTGIQDKQYENEVRHLMRLKHPNIVQLVGYCAETEKELVLHNGNYVYADKSERLLCFEYLPKGNLRSHISDESSGLDWDTRYKIIKGICYGLYYLHEEWQASTPIIHRDLKPANILLDHNMVPKIADFGLSRLFGEEQTRTITKNYDGTLGYMAPEYLNRGIITKELDIFSLGVIIIEIVTGHRHYPYKDETSLSQEFIDHVLKKWRNRLESTARETHCQQIRMCIETGLLCVKYERAERPKIRQIIKTLASGGAEYSNEERQGVPRKATETIAAAAKETSSTIHEDKAKKDKKSLYDGLQHQERPSSSVGFLASGILLLTSAVVQLFGWWKLSRKNNPDAYAACSVPSKDKNLDASSDLFKDEKIDLWNLSTNDNRNACICSRSHCICSYSYSYSVPFEDENPDTSNDLFKDEKIDLWNLS